ncbi:hypothetical protein VTK56DRAFT_7289 [Thermocarpiscus australiensis]
MQKKAGRAPSGHLSRLKPAVSDPLAEYGLPSKGEKRLLSPKVQEAYYAKIVERYLAFCTDAGDRDGLQRQFARLAITSSIDAPPPTPSSSASQPTSSSSSPLREKSPPSQTDDALPQILSALRKLREAIVASSRRDAFAAQAYLFAIRLGIQAASYETYYPALLHLLRGIHHHRRRHNNNNNSTTSSNNNSNNSNDGNLTTLELREAAAYLVLDAACRRGDLAEAYALRHAYRAALGGGGGGDAKLLDGALRALAQDNWVAWRRVKSGVDGHRARLMEFAEARVRAHTLKAFGRAYLSVPVAVLEAQTGSSWDELRERDGVGWELSEDGRVVIRKVQSRS